MDIWIITEVGTFNMPIICASSHEKAIQYLFDYMGYEGKDSTSIIYLGYEEPNYSDEVRDSDFKGTFTFQTCYTTKEPKQYDTDKYRLYQLTLNKEQKVK